MKKFNLLITIMFLLVISATCQVDATVNVDTGSVIFPLPIDPLNPDSLFAWWQFIYALLTPVGVYIFNKYFPSNSQQELIIKSSSVAILVLIVIIFFKGFSLLTLGQAIIAFIMQVINYDKVLKPLGMESPKLKSYKH
jgi:hypothetical protein